MNILVTGASGFVGSKIVTDLLLAGHNVTCCVRDVEYTKRMFPSAIVIPCNFTQDTAVSDWLPRLKNIDVVINTVGIFYHPNKKIIWLTHFETPKALFEACVKSGVKKIIQLSALGADKYDNDYANSKLAADKFLSTLSVPSIIIRPSFIYSQSTHGGSSLFRGLAGLPLVIPLPDKGKQAFQPIYLADLSRAITNIIEKPVSGSIILDAVSKEKITLRNILVTIRQWLAFPKAILLPIPSFMLKFVSIFGNLIPYSVINSQGTKMLLQDNVASFEEADKFSEFTQVKPRDFSEGMFSVPGSVQDRWYARLYFAKPLLQFSLAFVWIFTGICSLWIYPREDSYALLQQTGINTFWQPIMLYGAALMDLIIGLALLFNFKIKIICLFQILIIFIYTLIITIKIPSFWFHPFGPISKNIPFMVSIYILYILQSR